MDAEELGLRKPSANERLAASRVHAYNSGQMDIVSRLDEIKARRAATRRLARQRKTARKAALRAYMADQKYDRDRDPPSSNNRPSA